MAMLVERLLLRLALRRDFTSLKKEIIRNRSSDETAQLYSGFTCYEMNIETTRTIINADQRGFNQYPLAVSLLESLQDHFGVRIDQHFTHLFDYAVFYLKTMHLMSTIGGDAAEKLTESLLNWFPNSNNAETEVLAEAITQSVYSGFRKFVLRVLLRDEYSEQFSKHKFPSKYWKVADKLRTVFSELSNGLNPYLPQCELMTQLEQLPVDVRRDPSVLLYYETFAENGKPRDDIAEDDLIRFVQMVRASQLSINTPNLVLPLLTISGIRASFQATTTDQQDVPEEAADSSPSSVMEIDGSDGSCDLFVTPGPQQNANIDDSCAPNPELEVAKGLIIYGKEGELLDSVDLKECQVTLERMDPKVVEEMNANSKPIRHRRRRHRVSFHDGRRRD